MSSSAVSNAGEGVREGSAPNFCPPIEEGITLSFQDAVGDSVDLEFLGIVEVDGRQFGAFFPIDEENPALSSGEVVILEVVGNDDDDLDPDDVQETSFELVEDEEVALMAYEAFKEATKDLYRFE